MNRRVSSAVFVACLSLQFGCFSDTGGPGGSSGGEGESGESGGSTDGGETGTGSGSGTTGTDTDPTTTDATDTDPTTTTDTDPTTGGTPCGDADVCVPAPEGWEGPIAIANADAGCGDTYPDEAAALLGDFSVDSSSCECNCGNPNVQCSKVMKVVGYASPNCANGQGQNDISENQCYNTFSASHAVTLAKASSGCADGNVTSNLPEPTWNTSVVACGGASPGAGECDGGQLCVPAPGDGYDGGICYFADGDQECPAGFPNKTVYYTDYQDTRSCPGQCACSPSAATCKVSITGYANANCGSAQGAKTAYSGGDVCAASSSVVKSIRPGNVVVHDAGQCSPGQANLSGDVEPVGATTVCCTG